MSLDLISDKKKKWVKQFKPTAVMRGSALKVNAAKQSTYVRELTALAARMTAQVQREIIRFFDTKHAEEYFAADASVSAQAKILTNSLTAKFEQLFARAAEPAAKGMVDGANAASKTALGSSLTQLSGGLTLKTDVMNDQLKNIMAASVAENVGLIKSIASEYLSSVQGAVMRSITTGNGLQDLIPFLEKHENMTIRRAKNIALDQTRKAYNTINKGRMQAVGVSKYEWLHTAGGQHPREEHVQMSGNIYSFDDPPVIDSSTGERGIPGQLPNCKCVMIPVIEFDEGEPK